MRLRRCVASYVILIYRGVSYFRTINFRLKMNFRMKSYFRLRRVSKKVKNGKNGKKGRKIWGIFDQKKSEGSWVQS